MLSGEQWDVVIVGAGLAGLTAASLLHHAGLKVVVLEARDRVGGRTFSPPASTGSRAWGDLGPSWSWPHQPRIRQLAQDLGVGRFEQHVDGDALYDLGTGGAERHAVRSPMTGALRFVGGAQALSQALAARLPQESVHLNTVVTAVQMVSGGVQVQATALGGNETTLHTQALVLALPPRLIAGTLQFIPELPAPLREALTNIPTWMGHVTKVVVHYPQAFWRAQHLSGFTFSPVGPLQEIHDASPPDQAAAALFGFLSARWPWRELTPDHRRAAVLEQLSRLFGRDALNPLAYQELDWSQEPYTSSTQDGIPPREHPQYGHALFEEASYGGRVFWAGAETSALEGGLLEGAVRSGERAAELILQRGRPS